MSVFECFLGSLELSVFFVLRLFVSFGRFCNCLSGRHSSYVDVSCLLFFLLHGSLLKILQNTKLWAVGQSIYSKLVNKLL